MRSRPVARLLWCAPSERKGCGSTLGQQELAVASAVAVGRAASGTAGKTEASAGVSETHTGG